MSRLPLVLAIEPDLRQAAIVKRVVKERVQAEIVVVDSRDAAIAAIKTAMPDVLLVSALLSPRDEDELMAHLRTLEGAAHLQTHTIPQLASTLGGDDGGRGGLFSAFRRKKSDSVTAGCDPDMFADEIRMYVKRAEERKREAALAGPVALPTRGNRAAETPVAAPAQEAAPVPSSSWSSPFEWRPSNHSAYVPSPAPPIESPAPPMAEPSIATPEPAIVLPESGDLGSGIGDLGSGIGDLESGIGDLGAENGDLGSGIWNLGPGIGELESDIGRYDQESAVRDSLPPVLAAWARQRPSIADLECAPPAGEFHELLAGLGVPEEVASVAYANGCRIRRVRVPVAREQHGPLHGAVVLSRRMLAELRGTDVGA